MGLNKRLKQRHKNFDEVVLANGFNINQSDKCVYSKFNDGQGVIICLYVDDILIFDTYIEQIKNTKNFLSSNLAMKDMNEADIIFEIRIIRDDNDIILT